MTNLIINSQPISQHNGLFSLNDLHKVSGNDEKHRPTWFLRNDETQALIHEIESENQIAYDTVIGKGKKQGTYACRELVYRYAMWISPKFSLMVIRAFDALNTGAIPCLPPKSTAHDRTPLRQAVTALTAKYGLMHDEAYRLVHQYMGVEHIDEIALHDLPKAVEYVHGLMLNGLTKPQLSHATLERLSKQFSKTAILMNHIKNEYLPFLSAANQQRGEKLSGYLTLLKYDIEDNTRDLFSLLSDDIKTNKQHPITKHLEMAYYADNLLLCPSKAV